MAKRKTKEQLLAEIAYAIGRKHAIEKTLDGCDEEEIVRTGAQIALAEWKEQAAERKKVPPSDIELARKQWTDEGCSVKGTLFNGNHYFFEPDGNFQLKDTFAANFGLSNK